MRFFVSFVASTKNLFSFGCCLTCSQHRNLQNIHIHILQIFFMICFCLIKSRVNCSVIKQPFLNRNLIFFSNTSQIVCCRIIKKNQTKDLETSNSNILEVPMLGEVSCHKKEWPTLGQIVSFFIIRGHSQTTFTIFGFF